MTSSPRILFLAEPEADYVADGLFHGLRTLLGGSVVDYPRRAAMYAGAQGEAETEGYGRRFGLYGMLEDVPIDRTAVFEREWDLVISAVMWRDWVWWERAWRAFGAGVRHAAVDGGDLHWMYPYGPAWWRPWRCFAPRAHTRARYFKREWSLRTMLAAGRPVRLEPIAIAYPREKMSAEVPVKTQEFGSHIVDLDVGEHLGRRLSHERQYVFEREADYLADLRASRFGVTTKRAGWDAQRHLEIAGAGAIPCFRDLDRKPATCAPYGLVVGENCLSYRDAEELMSTVAGIAESERMRLAQGALSWAHANSTVERATRFLERAL